MKVLIIKTSSLGDVIHTLPALTDAGKAIPGIRFDWVVEQAFAEVPTWHPLVDRVIPVSLRRWRKRPWKAIRTGEWKNFRKQLRTEKYDLVLDAQGLIKSAFLAYFARGIRAGLDRYSAWEPLATCVYQRKYAVNPDQHAVRRIRQLFAAALGYAVSTTTADYGIDLNKLINHTHQENDIIFLHGTTWRTKHWPESYWRQLAEIATKNGYRVKLPWGNITEHERAQRIAEGLINVQVLPKLNLTDIAKILASAKASVAVDTGLGHLAAALRVPTISLYGPTDPLLTGTVGDKQIHLAAQFPCAPCLRTVCNYTGPREVEPACFGTLPPKMVWEKLNSALKI